MYHLINRHIQAILQSFASKDATDVSVYDWLVQNLNNVATPDYQQRYCKYWVMNGAGLSQQYRTAYFHKLQAQLASPQAVSYTHLTLPTILLV